MSAEQSNRVKLDARKVDSLIVFGMSKFATADIYVAPATMSKLVRDSIRKFGYVLAERIVIEYFDAAERLHWESYRRAQSERNQFHRPGATATNKEKPPVRSHGLEGQSTNPLKGKKSCSLP